MNTPAASRTWAETVEPIVKRLRLSAMMGLGFVHKPAGAQALAGLLSGMAQKLDRAVEMQLAEQPDDQPDDAARVPHKGA